ncbi:UNVERIFIED_CONTAM: hypothetical protein K2H54_047527 [Gekko kuhli]
MDLAKVRGCLAVSILPLLLLVDPTAACYCLDRPPVPLQTAYCTSDVVIAGMFVDSRFPDPDDKTWAIYEFKVTKVFKGSVEVGEKVDLYTKFLGTTCEYRHDGPFTDDVYVVGGPSLPLQALLRHFSLAVPVDNWDLTNYGVSPGCRFGLPCQSGIPNLCTEQPRGWMPLQGSHGSDISMDADGNGAPTSFNVT